ncbi:MAG: 16S rRNA (adenine(1518)-N(6)/adenine(1519)-N(6))-dimethyltransferase RsmA [Candidatus Berkelbacteria bacterium]|nr:16S rRNA (adenine(1518)-N(6)/adenine(1519)-N(6))-dimethyltransferase RsmA [Candidatus Berkelbacteria bacterium]
MVDLTDKSQLIIYLKANNLWAKHSLGQNFLISRDVLEKIIQSAELGPNDTVVEVGPGLGALTTELVSRVGKVIAIEKDEKLASILSSVISTDQPEPRDLSKDFSSLDKSSGLPAAEAGRNDTLTVLNSDILTVNIPELIGNQKYKVVANIPYYITSKILRLFLESKNKPDVIVMLVQKEVAERICSMPGDMSVLAISIQYYGDPGIIDIVPKESFFPAPEVDSAILRIRIKKEEERIKVDEKAFFHLVHIGFASKRKTLANNLSAGFHIDKNLAADIIKSIGLNESVRAQELSLDEWSRLLEELGIRN